MTRSQETGASLCRVCEAIDCTNYDNLCSSCTRTADAAPALLAGAKAMLAARDGKASMDAILSLRDAIAKAEGRS